MLAVWAAEVEETGTATQADGDEKLAAGMNLMKDDFWFEPIKFDTRRPRIDIL